MNEFFLNHQLYRATNSEYKTDALTRIAMHLELIQSTRIAQLLEEGAGLGDSEADHIASIGLKALEDTKLGRTALRDGLSLPLKPSTAMEIEHINLECQSQHALEHLDRYGMPDRQKATVTIAA